VRGIDRAGNVSAWASAAVPMPTAAPAAPQQATVELTGTTVRESGDAVVGARCQSTSGRCQVRITLLVGRTAVSSRDGVIEAGRTASLTAKLPATLQRTLARRGTMPVTIRSEVTSDGATSTVSSRVTLVAPDARTVVQAKAAPQKGSDKAVTVSARCRGGLATRCRAQVDLQLVGAGTGRRASNQVTVVGRAKTEGPSGSRIGAKVALNATGQRLLKKHGTLRVRPVIRLGGRAVGFPARVVLLGGMDGRTWIRAVLGELDRHGPVRADLNATLDRVHAREITPQAGADIIEKEILPDRVDTLTRLRALPPPPARLDYVRRDVIEAFEVSIAANRGTMAHLRAGGMPTNDPTSRLHERATVVKKKLMADLAREGKPLGIAVPPARSLWP
jgi:hypothetical protein